jgi:hypothetical protein
MNIKYSICLIFTGLFFGACQPAERPDGVDLKPIKNLILFDRHAVEQHDQNVEQILTQCDSISIPALNVQAYCYAWGGEVGGPWKRILCFYRPYPKRFQCEFVYEGEYDMSRMRNRDICIKSGMDHCLGTQLTAVGSALGDEVKFDRDKMKILLISVMEHLLGCQPIRRSFMDSLDVAKTVANDSYLNSLKHNVKQKYIEAMQKVKTEMTAYPDPYVLFFNGELIYGIWKGTVRQYDHTGRFCIELEYLNGEFAYTIWM